MSISYLGQLITGTSSTGVLDDSGVFATTHTATVKAGAPTILANDLVVWGCVLPSGVTISSGTDTHSNTYSALWTFANDTSTSVEIGFYGSIVTTPLVAGDTLSLTLSGNTIMLGCPVVFRGVTNTSDGTNNQVNQFNSVWSTSSVTPTANPELALSIGACNSAVASFGDVPSSGWTDIVAYPTWHAFVFQYQITASNTALSGGGTFQSGGSASLESYAAEIGVLKAASGAVLHPSSVSGAASFAGAQSKRISKLLVS